MRPTWALAVAVLASACSGDVIQLYCDAGPSFDRMLDAAPEADAASQDTPEDTPDAAPDASPSLCPEQPCLRQGILRAVGDATFVLLRDGRSFYWGGWPDGGWNDGLPGTTPVIDRPTAGPTLSTNTVDVRLSFEGACALFGPNGTVSCWGRLLPGSLDPYISMEPRQLDGVNGIGSIAFTDNALWMLRGDEILALGDTLVTSTFAPHDDSMAQRLFVLPSVARFANSTTSGSLGIVTTDGRIFTSTFNDTPRSRRRTYPTIIDTGWPVRDFSIFGGNGCFISTRTDVTCWGRGPGLFGQGPTNTETPDVPDPVPIFGLQHALRVYVSDGFACTLTRDHSVQCWGNNEHGQLGLGVHDPYVPPGRTLSLPPVRELALGYRHACALTMNDEVYCWGDHNQGQLGNPRVFAPQFSPVLVPLPR